MFLLQMACAPDSSPCLNACDLIFDTCDEALAAYRGVTDAEGWLSSCREECSMASDPDGWADDVYLVWSDLGECRHIVTGDVSPCESVGMEESTSSYWSCE